MHDRLIFGDGRDRNSCVVECFKKNSSTIVKFWIFFLALKPTKDSSEVDSNSESDDDMMIWPKLKIMSLSATSGLIKRSSLQLH